MKCMIAFSCLLAVASAGYLGNAAYNGAYGGAYGGAYAGALGYANHGSHAVAYNAPLVAAPHPVAHAYAGPLAHAYAANTAPIAHGYAGVAHGYAGVAHGVAPIAHGYGYAAPLASEARLVDPIAIAAGAPLPTGDTVEVAAAKAAHFQAHAAAKSIAYSAAPVAHGYAGVAHGYAAHAVAPVAHGYGYGHAAPLVSEARLVDPVAIAAGAPLPGGDTVEVAAAKAFHAQAHHAAKTGHFLGKRSPGYLNAGYASPLAYAAPAHSYGYSSIGSPLAYSGYSGYGYGGHVSPYYG